MNNISFAQRHAVRAAITALCGVASCSAAFAASGTLTGFIRSAATTVPIRGAVVKAGTLTATTSPSGTYVLRGDAGSYTLTVSVDGFQPTSQAVAIKGNTSTSVNVNLAPAPKPAPPPAPAPPTSTSTGPTTSHYWLGANYAWQNYGTDFGTGGWGKFTNWAKVNADFAALHAQGVSVVRWWLFGDGRYSPEFSSTGTVTGLDSSVLPNVDQALAIAKANNVRILFCVIDSSMLSKANVSGSVQMGGHAALVTSGDVQQSFLTNALKPLVVHIAQGAYAAQLAGYDIINEPEAQESGYWGGSNLSAAALKSFVQQCANCIHSNGAGALATVGSACADYVAQWKGLGLDFYQVHYYPWMDYGRTPGSGLKPFASLGLDKPCIVGEFPTNDASYGAGDTSALSAKWYLDAPLAQGYAGAMAWSYSGGDSASNWTAFQPVFTAWAAAHATVTVH